MPLPLRGSSRLVFVVLIACAGLVKICLSQDAIDPSQDVVEFYMANEKDGWNENSEQTSDADDQVEHKEVRFDQVSSETAPPYPDVKPAPGTSYFRVGLDRFDGRRAYLPLFTWTWGKYIEYERRLNDAANGIKPPLGKDGQPGLVRGHHQQITIAGEPLAFMIADQLYYDGPQMRCEQNREADSETITSSEEMTESEQSSFKGGYEMEADVSAADPSGSATVSTSVRNAMMVGTSNESKDYKKAASKGYTRSVFSTITSKVWTGYLVDDSAVSMEFKEAVERIQNHMSAEPDNESKLNLLLGQLMFNFGTDYMVSADFGGKIVKQTSAQTEDKNSISTQAMKNENSVSMQVIFDKLDASSKSSTKAETTTGSSKGLESSTAKFYGGIPSTSYEEWCDSTRQNPWPLHYMTREITYILENHLDAKELAQVFGKFIYTRAAQRESCEAAGAGLVYNGRNGKCEMPPMGATCPSGQVKHKAKTDFTYNGQFMYHKGQMICEKCAAGKEAKIGAASCSDCETGYFAA